MLDGVPRDDDIEQAASIVARYGQGRDLPEVLVEIRMKDGSVTELKVKPLPADEVLNSWHV